MLDDNEISLTLTKDQKSQNRTKHIDIIYYYIWRSDGYSNRLSGQLLGNNIRASRTMA